jgi:hypothetical protein
MRRTILSFLTLALLTALNATAAFDSTTRRTFSVADGGTLTIEADSADLRILTGGSGVQVEVVRHTKAGDRVRADELFAKYALTFEQSGNDVTFRGKYDHPLTGFMKLFDGDDDLQIRYLVHVPSRYNVTLKTSGGNIDVGALAGAVDARTSGGNVALASVAGPVIVRTSGGDIKLIRATGKVDVKTSGGSIQIEDAGTNVDARTSGGNIHVGRAGGEVYVRTSGGNIDLGTVTGAVDARTSGGSVNATLASTAGPSTLSSSGGEVTVAVSPSAALDLDARSSGGGVESDLPVSVTGRQKDGVIVGKINGGGPQLTLRSSGGGIRVKRSL